MTPDTGPLAADPTAPSVPCTPDRLQDLLAKTSRTFALNIPLLDEPTRCEVTVAYLLFRVADTLEDSTSWTAGRRVGELDRLAALLGSPDPTEAATLAARWNDDPPSEHAGYRELLGELPAVLRVAMTLAPEAREIVLRHTLRTIAGMQGFLARGGADELRLRDVEELRAYCYAVAGIVGEMLTELFIRERGELAPVAASLRELAPTFGEALQLVNILKDAAWDSAEGRHFLPDPGGGRGGVYALARRDMDGAARYVACLAGAGAPRGIVAFTALPLLLARATIDRVERDGPGAKIERCEVIEIVETLERALEARSVPRLLDRFGAAREEE